MVYLKLTQSYLYNRYQRAAVNAVSFDWKETTIGVLLGRYQFVGINLKRPLMFICRQKKNCILHVSLEILQIYCKRVTLGMAGYAHPKQYYKLVENFRVYLQSKNQLHPQRFSEDIAKIYKLLTLGIWACLLRTPKIIVSRCRKLRSLSACQK